MSSRMAGRALHRSAFGSPLVFYLATACSILLPKTVFRTIPIERLDVCLDLVEVLRLLHIPEMDGTTVRIKRFDAWYVSRPAVFNIWSREALPRKKIPFSLFSG